MADGPDLQRLAQLLMGKVNPLEEAPQRALPWIQPQLLAPGPDAALNQMILQRGEWGTMQDPMIRQQYQDPTIYQQWLQRSGR